MGRIWDHLMEQERKAQELAIEQAEWERINTCKVCKKIVRGDLYPYKKGIFGGVKNYTCKDCAKKLKLI